MKKFDLNSANLEEKYIQDGYIVVKNIFKKNYIDRL